MIITKKINKINWSYAKSYCILLMNFTFTIYYERKKAQQPKKLKKN